MQLHLLSRQLVTVGAACRPYVYLKEYDVQDPDGDMLRQKLRTANRVAAMAITVMISQISSRTGLQTTSGSHAWSSADVHSYSAVLTRWT